jgi:hypothetical protein
MKTLTLLSLALMPSLALAQWPDVPPVKAPALALTAPTPEAFVPTGWVLVQQIAQDFDGDGRPDALLLLRMNDPHNVLTQEGMGESPLDTNPRLLAAVLAEGQGYRLAFQNLALIPRHDTPTLDDPFTSVESIKGGFDVSLHSFANAGSWWMGNTKFRFRFQGGCFRLIGYDTSSVHRASQATESTSANYLTGLVVQSRSEGETDKPEVTRKKLKSKKPVCIEAMGDGFEFQPGL